MLAKACSAALNGIEAYPVEVEVNAGYGDTILVIVGAIPPKTCFVAFYVVTVRSARFRGYPV